MTVLVAYNASPQGESALRAATAEAERRRQDLSVLVLTPQESPDIPSHLAHLLDSVPPSVTVKPVAYRTASEEVADSIIEAAERVAASLVVIGARKHSTVGTFLVGSTTQQVLLDSPAPVLVVKAGYA
ncbi:universal stress protein [Myceligenerans xiligouense]|uniref:Universal stress protein family protein n=1 Tax=Myceligenerans xiligouense TaxID=253184 RepID=A0A3N4YR84_9MICO|nr:universal stress protein [Myceligenerans xiligouense]RPF22627.1 universal stress protein family protein [Myceligenerans xiligouense]